MVSSRVYLGYRDKYTRLLSVSKGKKRRKKSNGFPVLPLCAKFDGID
jgi:hypothetical protein